MLLRIAPLFLILLVSSCASTTPPLVTSKKLIAEAVDTLYQFSLNENLKHYNKFLKRASGIVILPEVVKAGWFAGAEAGNGILLVRQTSNNWSDPSFYTLATASVGLQIGIQNTAILLVLRTPGALQSILKHQGKFGADIGATVVFYGIGAEAATTSNLGADIIAFAASNIGAFIGGSLEGSVLVIRRDLNEAVYGVGATPESIIAGKWKTGIAQSLKDALNR